MCASQMRSNDDEVEDCALLPCTVNGCIDNYRTASTGEEHPAFRGASVLCRILLTHLLLVSLNQLTSSRDFAQELGVAWILFETDDTNENVDGN